MLILVTLSKVLNILQRMTLEGDIGKILWVNVISGLTYAICLCYFDDVTDLELN